MANLTFKSKNLRKVVTETPMLFMDLLNKYFQYPEFKSTLNYLIKSDKVPNHVFLTGIKSAEILNMGALTLLIQALINNGNKSMIEDLAHHTFKIISYNFTLSNFYQDYINGLTSNKNADLNLLTITITEMFNEMINGNVNLSNNDNLTNVLNVIKGNNSRKDLSESDKYWLTLAHYNEFISIPNEAYRNLMAISTSISPKHFKLAAPKKSLLFNDDANSRVLINLLKSPDTAKPLLHRINKESMLSYGELIRLINLNLDKDTLNDFITQALKNDVVTSLTDNELDSIQTFIRLVDR